MTSSKKLLMSDPKPKPLSGQPTTPPNSASSSSATATLPPDKRTRDQPNLSDCHCCGRHINHTNPRDRLLPLDSLWRIVLLCRKCRKNFRSGQSCTYCFKRAENSGNLVECSVCESKIHEACVRDYGNCTPWCYLGAGLEGFTVCVDCWVPDMLKSSFRGFGRSRNKERSRDGKCNRVKKVKMASNAKEQALRKVMVAKKAMDVADKKDSDGQKDENSDCSDADLAIQLHRAINSLPRTSRSKFLLNSSTMGVLEIRNWNGLSYTRSGVGRGRDRGQKKSAYSVKTGENGLGSDVNGFKLRPFTYKRDKKRKIWQRNEENTMIVESRSSQSVELLHSDDARTSCSTDVSEALVCVNANESGPPSEIDGHISEALISDDVDQIAFCINIDRFGKRPFVYRRTRFRQKGQLNSLVDVSVECHFCDSDRLASKPSQCQPDEAKKILPNGSYCAAQDRYRLKYVKRRNSTKSHLSGLHSEFVLSENKESTPISSNSKTDYAPKNGGELILLNGSSDPKLDRCYIKYAKKRVKGSESGSSSETKLHYDASSKGGLALGLNVKFGAETITVSDLSLSK